MGILKGIRSGEGSLEKNVNGFRVWCIVSWGIVNIWVKELMLLFG